MSFLSYPWTADPPTPPWCPSEPRLPIGYALMSTIIRQIFLKSPDMRGANFATTPIPNFNPK